MMLKKMGYFVFYLIGFSFISLITFYVLPFDEFVQQQKYQNIQIENYEIILSLLIGSTISVITFRNTFLSK